MEGTVIVTVTPATAEKETSSLVLDSTRSDTPVRPSRPRNVLLDFLRALCVLFVVAHHASLRLDGVYFTGRFKGYPLSNNLWVLWYLAIMSGMLFGLSSGRLLPYLKRLFVVLAFGCVANLLGIVISWSTNPDANNEISVEGVLYQMYYVVFIGMFGVVSYPARQACIQSQRPHPALAAISCLICGVFVVMPYTGLLPVPGYHPSAPNSHKPKQPANGAGWPDYRRDTSAEWLDCRLQVTTVGTLTALRFGWPRLAGSLFGLALVLYVSFVSRSFCRDAGDLGKIIRFVWWYSFGLMWAALLKARTRLPEVAAGVRLYMRCFESYFLVLVWALTTGQTTIQEFREPDLHATASELVNGLVALKDLSLLLLFFGLSQTNASDPFELATPLNYWSLLAYCLHYAVLYVIPGAQRFPERHDDSAAEADMARDSVQLGTCMWQFLTMAAVVGVHKAARRMRTRRDKSRSSSRAPAEAPAEAPAQRVQKTAGLEMAEPSR